MSITMIQRFIFILFFCLANLTIADVIPDTPKPCQWKIEGDRCRTEDNKKGTCEKVTKTKTNPKGEKEDYMKLKCVPIDKASASGCSLIDNNQYWSFVVLGLGFLGLLILHRFRRA